jgi:porin
VRASFPALVMVAALTLGPTSQPGTAQDKGFFERETLSGDWAGVRKQLLDAGVELGLEDIAETLSNPTGGVRQRTVYEAWLRHL